MAADVVVIGSFWSDYFFLLKRLKRFSLSFSRLPGLDSARGLAGSVCARLEAGVLWLLGATSERSEGVALEIAWIQEFISSLGEGRGQTHKLDKPIHSTAPRHSNGTDRNIENTKQKKRKDTCSRSLQCPKDFNET